MRFNVRPLSATAAYPLQALSELILSIQSGQGSPVALRALRTLLTSTAKGVAMAFPQVMEHLSSLPWEQPPVMCEVSGAPHGAIRQWNIGEQVGRVSTE